ncbi:MAG: HlyC/CorC family transporter [Ruminococcaceae bacterium]|nr:HlyC/CorC family transporter [Oscillospiraceae bacterium]
MNTELVPSIVAMVCCIIMSAYFSATETAFSSLNKTRLKAMAEKGNRRADLALRLSEQYDKLISTILVGNNIVNIAMASLGTLLFVGLYGDIGATVSTVVVTVVVLIFGEITPKSIAKDYPEKFAMFSAPIIRLLIWVLTPVNFLFTQWKKLVSRLFHSSEDTKMSQEELLLLVDEVQQEGSIDETEGELLRNAIEFRDLVAEDILTHRVDLEAVPVDATKEEIAECFTQSRYSRLLVYEETIDNIVGVIHQKDFYVGGGITHKAVSDIMTPPVFIHQSEKISDLLQFLQSNKAHIAIVIDEYGGTLGIVTMEDILEELVGEIWDEHDEVEEDFRKLEADTYLVDCSVNLDDFLDFFQIKSESDSISLGGWVMEQVGHIPAVGDHFTYDRLSVTVEETDAHRVTFVKVIAIIPAEDEVAQQQ